MGWLSRLLGAVSREELNGVHLDTTAPYWAVDGPRTFEELLRALRGWLPEDAVLYFEDGSPDAEIRDFMAEHAIPEQVHIRKGTWPRPRVFHVPATMRVLTQLAGIMGHHAQPELAIHFHVYRHGSVLLEWHDAFVHPEPMLLSGAIGREEVEAFAGRLGVGFRQVV